MSDLAGPPLQFVFYPRVATFNRRPGLVEQVARRLGAARPVIPLDE